MNKTFLQPDTFEHEGRQFEYLCMYAGDYIYAHGIDRILVNRATLEVSFSYKFMRPQ